MPAEGDRRSSEGRVCLGIYPMTIKEDDDKENDNKEKNDREDDDDKEDDDVHQ